jgi:hypothetical protein
MLPPDRESSCTTQRSSRQCSKGRQEAQHQSNEHCLNQGCLLIHSLPAGVHITLQLFVVQFLGLR